jgi:hypothetical protein
VIQDSVEAISQWIQRPGGNGVEVVAASTQEEQIQRNFQEAEKRGGGIVMLDAGGEDNATPPKRAATKKPSSAARRSYAKLEAESVSNSRDMPEIPLFFSASRKLP